MMLAKREKKCLVGMVCVLGMLFTIELVGRRFVGNYRFFFRSQVVNDMSCIETTLNESTPEELRMLCGKDYKETLQNVMNFVSPKTDILPAGSTIKDMYDHAKNGGMLTCAGMSELYLHALRLQNIKARKLFVVKNIGSDECTHTTVELFIDGKWRIFDPTFHVSFSKNDELIGAQEMSQSIIDGTYKEITPIFYGDVAYPFRLETYPNSWVALFNNVLIFKFGTYASSWVVRNTVGLLERYFTGPTLYYFSAASIENRYMAVLNRVYFLLICLVPIMRLIVFILFGLLIFYFFFIKPKICKEMT